MFGVIWTQVVEEVGDAIFQIMELFEASETQGLAKSFHEFLDYQKHLQWFTLAKNEHKEHLW